MALQRTSNKTVVELGTELKLNVHISPIGEMTIEDYDFTTEVYCKPKKAIAINKSDVIIIDDENYVICFDTTELGTGDLYVKVTAYIPDGDFDDGLRTEKVVIDTLIDVVKTA